MVRKPNITLQTRNLPNIDTGVTPDFTKEEIDAAIASGGSYNPERKTLTQFIRGSGTSSIGVAETNISAKSSSNRTTNSSGAYYGSSGINRMGTSATSGRTTTSTTGERMGVDRSSAIVNDPVTTYLDLFSPKTMLGRQDEIRRELANQRQAQIDAIQNTYRGAADTLAQNKEEDLARQRSLNLRAGLAGSDFGTAAKIKVRDAYDVKARDLAATRDTAIAGAIKDIEDMANQRIQLEQDATQKSFSNTLEYQKYFDTKQKEVRTQTLDTLTTLASANPNITSKDIAKRDPQLYEAIRANTGLSDFEMDAYVAKNSGIKTEGYWKGNNFVTFRTDAQGNPLSTRTYTAEELGVPRGVDMQIIPDEVTGNVYWYDKENPIRDENGMPKLQKLGQFQKPERTDGMSEKDRAIFNSIADKYAKSPLIAAADRTIVLKNTIDQINADPSNGAVQLNLAYSYIQALDTYQSAVREGELSLVNSIDSKIGQVAGAVEKIQNGQIVRPEVAKQLADAAKLLVNTINEGAKNTEKRYTSQAKVNGIENAWNDFLSGYSQSYNNTETKIDDLLQKYPNASEDELLQLLKEEGFSEVGNTRASANRPQRNNNPFNIKASEYTKTYAGVQGVDPVPAKDGGKFLVFNSPEAGIKAGERLLKSEVYRGLTVDQAMRRWSNNGYGGEIAPSIQGKRVDQLTPQETQFLLQNMAKREGFYA